MHIAHTHTVSGLEVENSCAPLLDDIMVIVAVNSPQAPIKFVKYDFNSFLLHIELTVSVVEQN